MTSYLLLTIAVLVLILVFQHIEIAELRENNRFNKRINKDYTWRNHE